MNSGQRLVRKLLSKVDLKVVKLVNYKLHLLYVDLTEPRKTSLKRDKTHFNLDVNAEPKIKLLCAAVNNFVPVPVSER